METHKLLSKDQVHQLIQDVPDFPKPGILFKDITPILQDPLAMKSCIHAMASLAPKNFNKIVAIESRGFLLGSALAQHFHTGLVLVRKPGKLPRKTISHTYELEYGTDTLEMHEDSLTSNDQVLIVDDVLATGGTAFATETLCHRLGSNVVGHLFLMRLGFLKGEAKLKAPTHSLFVI